MKTAAILLAAGGSRRFGAEDKLLSLLQGRPLVDYAASALRAFAPDILIGVARQDQVKSRLDGFDIAAPQGADPQQADSLLAGVTVAQRLGADRIVIALGDMPFVTKSVLSEMAALSTTVRPSAVTDGTRIAPPACFPAAFFPSLLACRGDRGAGSLLRDLPGNALLRVPQTVLQDVDTPEALREAEQQDFG